MRGWVIVPALGASAFLLFTPFDTYITQGPFLVSLLYAQLLLLEKWPPQDPQALVFTTSALMGPALLIMGAIFTRRSPWWYSLFTAIFLTGSMSLPYAVGTKDGYAHVMAERVQWMPAILALASAAAYLISMKKASDPAHEVRHKVP